MVMKVDKELLGLSESLKSYFRKEINEKDLSDPKTWENMQRLVTACTSLQMYVANYPRMKEDPNYISDIENVRLTEVREALGIIMSQYDCLPDSFAIAEASDKSHFAFKDSKKTSLSMMFSRIKQITDNALPFLNENAKKYKYYRIGVIRYLSAYESEVPVIQGTIYFKDLKENYNDAE